MPRPIGGMYRRNGTWWITFTVDGRKIRESTRSTRQADARTLLKQRTAEIQDGRFQPDGDRLTFGGLEAMIGDHYAQKRSRTRVDGALKHLRRHLGLYRAKALTFDRLMAYRNTRLEEGAAPATVKYELATLRKGLNIAVRSGKLTRRPPMPELTVENTRQCFFEAGELTAVVAQLPEVLRGVVQCAYHTGWRVRSELLTRQWRHVDLKQGIIRLEPGETKNGRGRTFPFAPFPALRRVLEEQRRYTDQVQRRTGKIVAHVFHREGKQIKDFYGAWRSACKRAGLIGKIPHDFRRTAVRNLERAGVPRATAMQLTGHLTESVYRRYDIVTERDLEEGVAKLAGLQDSASRKIVPMSVTSRSQSAVGRA